MFYQSGQWVFLSLTYTEDRCIIVCLLWFNISEPSWHSYKFILLYIIRSDHSLSRVWLFATPWAAACQASLSITNSQSLLKLTCIKMVMPSNPLVLCCPLLLPPSIFLSIRVFPMSQFFTSGGQSIGASASVLLVNTQDWFPLGLNGLISLQSKGLSRVFSNTTVQNHQFFGTQLYSPLSHPYMTTGKNIALTRWTFVGKLLCLCFLIYSLGWSGSPLVAQTVKRLSTMRET